MDDMNIQGATSAEVGSTASETRVDSGESSKNVASDRQAISDAKKRMFGNGAEVQSAVKPAEVEGKGEEQVAEGVNPEQTQPTEDRLQNARKQDKKQISKLVAQKHALKEENARLQSEIEKFKQKMGHEPQLTEFDDEQAYNRAKIRYDIELEHGVEHFQKAEAEMAEKKNTEWATRCKETVKNFDRFADDYSKHFEWLSRNEPELMSYAAQSIVGPRLIEDAFEDLFRNEQNYARWKGMNPAGRTNLLTKIEAALIGQIDKVETPQIQRKSAAPTPIAPEKASEKVASKAVSLKDQIARSKQRMFG